MTTFDEPLSWLMLERYALGELTEAERVRVEERLRTSAEDRACLERILHDDSELPPLPVPRPAVLPRRARAPKAAFVSALLAAAALLLMVLRTDRTIPSRRTLDGVKGGEIAIALHSDRAGAGPTRFSEGERFKVLVTCPPAFDRELSLFVFQAGQRFTPLGEARTLACGNGVPWPGAFTLDGAEPALVCLSWSAARASSLEELGEDAVCVELAPR